MLKSDIRIDKRMTINTGNYSSIQPHVSITIKDVDVDKIQEVYKQIGTIGDALFLKETSSLSELQEDFKRFGIDEIIKNIDINQMTKDVEESFQILKNM